tara:strand:+ start:819 stop:1439 length:621 start_codon:yes stop_codon:yes gene_type:complete
MEETNLGKKKLLDYFKENTKYIVSIFFLIIFLGAIFVWFEYDKKNTQKKVSEDFIEAKILISQNKKDESKVILKKIIEKKDKVYSPLSLFLLIDQNIETNQNIITKYFDILLSINNIEKEDKNLIKLKKAIYISEKSEENQILELLNSIVNSDSVWKIETLNFLGDYFFSIKQYQKAEQYYLMLLSINDANINKNEINRKLKLIKK